MALKTVAVEVQPDIAKKIHRRRELLDMVKAGQRWTAFELDEKRDIDRDLSRALADAFEWNHVHSALLVEVKVA